MTRHSEYKDLIQKTYLRKLNGRGNNKFVLDKKKVTIEAQENLQKDPASRQMNIFDQEKSFQVVDLFCGAGGMSLGFDSISRSAPFFEILGGCDIDQDALETYTRNLNAPGVNADVRELAESDRAISGFLEEIDSRDESKPLVLIGCAPCQGFTSHRKKNWSENDIRNTLITAFATVATRLEPDCVVMENVPEMLSEKYWEYFRKSRNILRDSGYIVKQGIYNAAEFGVPQERFRSVVIAMKDDFEMPETTVPPSQFSTVRDAIGDLPKVEPGSPDPNDSMHRCANHRQSTVETIKAVPKDGGDRPPGAGPKSLDEFDGYSDVYGRLSWDEPAITITHYARNPASGRFVHPEQHRGLTMREAAALQSFPDWFEFEGSFDSVFKQIGEAVPPQMACGIAASVLKSLISGDVSEEKEEISRHIVHSPVSSSYSSVISGIKSNRK
jgi:DNA (cytosine-5)-methyltransferase 1